MNKQPIEEPKLLSITMEEANLLLEGLGELKANKSYHMINKINLLFIPEPDTNLKKPQEDEKQQQEKTEKGASKKGSKRESKKHTAATSSTGAKA